MHIEEIQELKGGCRGGELGFVGIQKCLQAFHMKVDP